jgi:hypothetical protein
MSNLGIDWPQEDGKICFAILGKEGDKKEIWDKSDPDQVESARRTWNYLVGEKPYRAFKVGTNRGKAVQIRDFDPDLERIIFSPRMVGG